jgi:probable F420-dependent oxidoreductase
MSSDRRRAVADLAVLGVNLSAASLRDLRGALRPDVGAWIAEYTRDAYVTAAVLAEAGPARLGTAIAQAFPRSPLVTAHAALDLDELSGGRFTLGLGSQVRRANANWHGVRVERPVDQVADYVTAVRAAMDALRGGPKTYEGPFYQFDLRGRWRIPVPDRIPPILLAAAQPRMARAAGAVADGLVGHMLCTPAYFSERIAAAARAGAVGAGRDPDALELLVYRCCAVVGATPDAERDARRQIGFYAATRTYHPALAGMGFAAEAEKASAALASRDTTGLERAVSDAMLSAFATVGTVAECVRALREPHGPGGAADRMLLFPPYLDVPEESVRAAHATLIDVAAQVNAP